MRLVSSFTANLGRQVERLKLEAIHRAMGAHARYKDDIDQVPEKRANLNDGVQTHGLGKHRKATVKP